MEAEGTSGWPLRVWTGDNLKFAWKKRREIGSDFGYDSKMWPRKSRMSVKISATANFGSEAVKVQRADSECR